MIEHSEQMKKYKTYSFNKEEYMKGTLVLPIYVQSVSLPAGDDDVSEWNRLEGGKIKN